MQKRSIIALVTTLLLSTSMLLAQNPSAGNPHNQGSLAVPVTGSGMMTGVFNITHFAVQNNKLVAVGNLVATVGSVTTVLNNVALPASVAGTCPILTLTLGPLDLNLLGLDVTTNQINVNIVAESGAGNLLGNLLCDVSNLLNGPLSGVASALNSILAALGL